MPATRTIAGTELPAADTWIIDPGHAEVGFAGRHFGLTRIRGRFTAVAGTIVIAEEPAESSVEVVIEMASVSSGDQARDDHLRSVDFFDVDRYPTATYRSTSVGRFGSSADLAGELTIKDVTQPVHLDVDYLGHAVDPWGNDRAVFRASGRLNREEWGLTWNMLLEAGGLLVSKEINLEIEVELLRRVT
jgi:polyisoprenoid-binding protein YceI